MLYLTLFGLAIGYFSFLFNVIMATFEFKNIAMHLVTDWSRKSTVSVDIINSFVGQKYNMEMGASLPLIAFTGKEEQAQLNARELNFYIYNSGTGAWYRLYIDKDEIMRKAGVYDPDVISDMNEALKKSVKMTNVVYWGREDSHHLWVNLTRPGDRYSYIGEFVIKRSSIIHFFGGSYILLFYSMGIMLMSYLLSRGLSLYISKPIKKLSMQAEAISRGDFNLRIKIPAKDEIGSLSTAINTMSDEIKKQIDEINAGLSAISVMNKIDKAVLSSMSKMELIDNVTSIVSELFSECSLYLTVADFENERYHLLARFIKGKKKMPKKDYYLDFNIPGRDIVELNRSYYSIRCDQDLDLLQRLNSVAGGNYFHIMNLPIYMDDEYAGSLFISKDTDSPFTEFERDTLTALADQTGVAMKSVRYVEERENLFLGVLLALSRTIDTKSRWTSGHSERVADYSRKIAACMGVDSGFINNLSISASLHDIGKIGVPEGILDKEGKLTSEEFEVIKRHPQSGVEIIEAIPGFERFINGVVFHHESWDGSGYPFGLEKERIPLMGRIIAVADVYDSLISDRPYRKGINQEGAIDILKKEKGRKLDPVIVDIMIGIIQAEV